MNEQVSFKAGSSQLSQFGEEGAAKVVEEEAAKGVEEEGTT